MGGPEIRLRERRALHARQTAPRWRLPLLGAFVALVIGAACWAPTALAPTEPAAPVAVNPLQPQPRVPAPRSGNAAGSGAAPSSLAPALAATATPAAPHPTLAPTGVPAPVPELTPSGQAVLDSIRSDRLSQWVKNHAETALRSGPSDDSIVFTRLPQWTLLKQLDSRPDWILVQYSGDGETREAGPGWVNAGDVGAVDPPAVWLATSTPGTVWSAPDASGTRILGVPAGTLFEVDSEADFIRGERLKARSPGDGRSVPPTEGWLDANAVARAAPPSVSALPWAYPEDLHAQVRIGVPYRTQLDGSDYAGANCGPTALGMALEAFGTNIVPPDLRTEVLSAENFQPDDTDAGSYIWALADVAQSHGLHANGLYATDGSLHHWNLDEMRASLLGGQPVIVQVVYRGLPGRSDSGYYGDHFIVLTGLLGDDFLYNDPIGGAQAHEAPGYDRLISPAQLERAMHASDRPYAFSAFSLSK